MRMTILKYILISYIIFNALTLFPQDRQKTEANSDLIEYSNKEGLPTTNISNIVQSKDGYIWLSGIEGTYRFNGYEFEEVGKEFDLPQMQSMYYDSAKNMMYFASPKKFITFDGKHFKVFTGQEGYKINGLAGQLISFIKADGKGQIWIGSSVPFVDKKFNGGLTKFENGEFTVYDSATFPLNNATDFIETPNGDLIFNSAGQNTQTLEGSYVALFKNGTFRKIDEKSGITLQGARMYDEENVNCFDNEGNTWLACTGANLSGGLRVNSGVLMYDGSNFHQFTEVIQLLDKSQIPNQVYYSAKLNKLFLTTSNLIGEVFDSRNTDVFEFENGEWKASDIFEQIGAIRDLRSGSVINDFKYSRVYFQDENKYFPELLIFQGSAQAQSSKYSSQLFSFVDQKWQKFDSFVTGPGTEINEGVLMNASKGMVIYYPNYSRMLTDKDSLLLTQAGIPTLYTDYDGMVWISYSYSALPAYARDYDVGINVWDGKKLRSLTEKEGLASNITFQTFQDSKRRVWIPTSKGITLICEIAITNGEKIFNLKKIPDADGQPYNTSSVLETKTGDIYAWENFIKPEEDNLTGTDYYFGKFDGEKFVKIDSPFSDAENNKKYQILDLREDNDGRLWFLGIFADNIKDITSAQSKLMVYSGNAWLKPPESWKVPAEQLHYIGNLKNGMYFLTVGGFYVFDGNKFINLSDSVNANADFRILKGASVAGTKTDIQAGNNLYIRLRNRGLVIFDGTSLNFYTKKDGLPSTNISNPITDELRGAVYFSSPSGAIKISGNEFQTFYNDENIVSGGPYTSAMDGFGNMVEFYNGVGLYINKSQEKSYPLKISSVSIAGRFHYYEFPGELSYSQNSFLFNYAALNYKDPQQTTYEHFLEGYDKDWSKHSNLAFAEYQNLPFGEYIFRVRSITSNGIRTNEASYAFIITPPFWLTWWAYAIYAILFMIGVFTVDRYQRQRLVRRERERTKDRDLEQAKAIKKAYDKLDIAHTNLKATQAQLIQSEKMASLGELTAGIAHEIQNPLNFVNNFSEVSHELIDEMNENLDKGDVEEAKAISKDIQQNLEKITHHGKRADAIVKGMLLHSRINSGQKEPEDINALADEYLRLSYHGLRAKDKSFNAIMKTDFDESIGKINVVRQDIGRVILNLLTNAFYAVDEKKKLNIQGYEPTVSVGSKRVGEKIEIRIIDNGNGIPQKILDKIFQPFFTTKPSGEGTGLGLSLSYDIIKAHGGELKVETREGEGTIFIIHLPVNS